MAEKNGLSDIKKQEQVRRTELMMLYLLMDKYPHQVREKMRKSGNELNTKTKTANL